MFGGFFRWGLAAGLRSNPRCRRFADVMPTFQPEDLSEAHVDFKIRCPYGLEGVCAGARLARGGALGHESLLRYYAELK